MGRFVVTLDSRPALRESLAGGKGAGLARLARSGFRVPPGFVITTDVFRGALTAAVRRLISAAGPPDLENLEALRESFLSWDILPVHRWAILNAYRRMGGGPVAVRSSMVGEDSDTASFAGQLDSVLDVSGEEALLAAVRKCLASAFGSRLWAYIYQKDGAAAAPASGTMAMAVIVQRMLHPDVSGVAFSVDPMTSEPAVIIEAVPGLGGPLPQGRATPDRYRAVPGADLTVSVSSGRSLLGTEEVRELAGIVRAIADAFGSPQDIEWALDVRGFSILQTRPITALPARHVYSSRPVSNMAPGLVKPLVWSTVHQSMVKAVFGPIFEEVLGRPDDDYSELVARLHSRLYVDTTRLGEILARAGLPADLFGVLARDEALDDAPGSRPVRFTPRMVPLAFRAGRYAFRQLPVERRTRRFLEARTRELEPFRAADGGALPEGQLLARLDRLVELHGQSHWLMIHVGLNMLVRNRLLGRMLARWAPKIKPGDVLSGHDRPETRQPYDGLARLAAEAREVDPRILARVSSGDGVDLRAELRTTSEGQALLSQFEAFMGRFGFLSANGGDFSEASWVESPRLVWQTVARIALAHPSTLWDGAEARRLESLGRVRAALGPLRRFVFGRLYDGVERLAEARERIRLLMNEETWLMRRCILALGARLAARGAVNQPEDLFYLYADELRRILADQREAARAGLLVRERQAELKADAAIEPPETICGDPAQELGHGNAAAVGRAHRPDLSGEPVAQSEPIPTHLAGLGTSHGIARGRARIVRDPFLAAEKLEPTDILVVPLTDVGWTPLLAAMGGIVAETGGQLSHASIIARECGIPAVVGVKHATSLIHEGQQVTVDGTAGRVYLHQLEGGLG